MTEKDTCGSHEALGKHMNSVDIKVASMDAKLKILLWITGIGTAIGSATALAVFPLVMVANADITRNYYATQNNKSNIAELAEKNKGQHLREQSRLRDLERVVLIDRGSE